MLTDGSSTESTVLLESRSDVDDQTELADDILYANTVDAADGAESVVGAGCRWWRR